MVSEEELGSMIKEAKGSGKERKFTQSVELIMNFKDIDVKKGFQINETVQLPKTTSPCPGLRNSVRRHGHQGKERQR